MICQVRLRNSVKRERAVSDKCPYMYYSDVVVGETTCDGKKKMYELLGEIKNVFVLQMPQNSDTDAALDQWTAEMVRFKEYLEDLWDTEITEDAIRESVRRRNKIREIKRNLLRMQTLTPPPEFGKTIFQTNSGSEFFFEHSQIQEKLDSFRENVMKEYEEGARPVSETAKRILITGCPIGGALEKTVGCIEENGGVVVCFENCNGEKQANYDIDPEADDIYRAIAEHYLKIGCAVMSPDEERIEHLKKAIEDYKVDGVVEVDLQYCTPYLTETHWIKKAMAEIDMPYIAVEADYGKEDSGQLATRLEAFIEML